MPAARTLSKTVLLALAIGVLATGAQAQQATEIQLSYKDKKFDPPEVSAPANTPIVIKIRPAVPRLAVKRAIGSGELFCVELIGRYLSWRAAGFIPAGRPSTRRG